MKSDKYKLNSNYYAYVDRTKIYVDLTNKRVKILNNDTISVKNLKRIIHYSCKQHLGKIICNCDNKSSETFLAAGFKLEGKIPGYFKGSDALCMSYFISSDREVCSNFINKASLVKECLSLKNTFSHSKGNLKYIIRNATETDIKEMVKLFSTVFSTYPSPIYNEEYIKQTMKKKVLYKVAVYDGKIISAASADMDKENLNAEITDCATYPDYSSKGILSRIIHSLECDLKLNGFRTLYSLSRAICPSINFALSKHGYTYEGRLVNNCNICNTFEDMNIWVKRLKTR